jgi:hypothetical protein
MMSFLEQWIEYDYNPFITFNKDGKIQSINKEGQYLLGDVPGKTIFELALSYASASFGFKTTIVDLDFKNHKFFAILVGYESEHEIGIKLYKSRRKQFNPIKDIGESTNIYSLLDLCISASSLKSSAKFAKNFDPTLPDVRLHISDFTKILTNIYDSALNSSLIETSLYLKTGEIVRFEDKKYSIFTIDINADAISFVMDAKNESLANNLNCMVHVDRSCVSLAFPLIIS